MVIKIIIALAIFGVAVYLVNKYLDGFIDTINRHL